ncbi:hypothetical protein VTN49DRAFT_4644 [Thermomyces lanuginosus]|uniref:uncharacterized protein n=1 Tax=Thermomyces lanuginosus TaxID=5541 RepID=UPI00374222C3
MEQKEPHMTTSPSRPPILSPSERPVRQTNELRDTIRLAAPTETPYHIFFLPGNPGIVEYYLVFLEGLYNALNNGEKTVKFHVAGRSLAGFELNTSNSSWQPEEDHLQVENKPLNISEQVDFCLHEIRRYMRDESANTTVGGAQTPHKLILIAHSFGAFVVTEILKRLASSSPSKAEQDRFHVIGAVLLFPPIPDLEASPRGSQITSVARSRYLVPTLSVLSGLVNTLPLFLSRTLVRYVTAFPDDALEITRRFVTTRTAVAQSLYLVKYELDEIKWCRWEDAFSTIRAGPFPTKIRLFFGKNDYWVANDLRDAFIAKHCSPESNRGALDVSADIDPSEDGDEESVVIPHDFSIRHSEHVIPYVVRYIHEIID